MLGSSGFSRTGSLWQGRPPILVWGKARYTHPRHRGSPGNLIPDDRRPSWPEVPRMGFLGVGEAGMVLPPRAPWVLGEGLWMGGGLGREKTGGAYDLVGSFYPMLQAF